MRNLVTLAVMLAVLGAIVWWQRRRHPDVETEAKRAGLVGAPSRRQSVLQLARVEAFRLHVHPATIVGFVLVLLLGRFAVLGSERVDLATADTDQVLVCVLFGGIL